MFLPFIPSIYSGWRIKSKERLKEKKNLKEIISTVVHKIRIFNHETPGSNLNFTTKGQRMLILADTHGLKNQLVGFNAKCKSRTFHFNFRILLQQNHLKEGG